MKRRAVQLVVLLMLGAIVNVAVAWACFYSEIGFSRSERVLSQKEKRWLADHGEQACVEAEDDGKFAPVVQVFRLGLQADLISLESPALVEHLEKWKGVYIDFLYSPGVTISRSGVPLYSMTHVHWKHTEEWMIHHSTDEWDEYTVTPLWPGFAINTIFYAAILWVMFFVPGMVKRTLRRRRGLCPVCAYPVGTSSVCTECGAALTCDGDEHARSSDVRR